MKGRNEAYKKQILSELNNYLKDKRYIITPGIFDILENTKPGRGGEIQLTDALKVLAAREAMYAFEFEGKRYDVGDKLGFLQAQ